MGSALSLLGAGGGDGREPVLPAGPVGFAAVGDAVPELGSPVVVVLSTKVGGAEGADEDPALAAPELSWVSVGSDPGVTVTVTVMVVAVTVTVTVTGRAGALEVMVE